MSSQARHGPCYHCSNVPEEGRRKCCSAPLQRENPSQRVRSLTCFSARFQAQGCGILQKYFDCHIFSWEWHDSMASIDIFSGCHFRPPLSDWHERSDSCCILSSSASASAVVGYLRKVFTMCGFIFVMTFHPSINRVTSNELCLWIESETNIVNAKELGKYNGIFIWSFKGWKQQSLLKIRQNWFLWMQFGSELNEQGFFRVVRGI